MPKLEQTSGEAEPAQVLRRAQGLLADGQAGEAEPLLRELLEDQPSLTAAWLALARCLLALGDRDGELEACRRALALDPGLTYAHVRAGALLTKRGELVEAARHFQAASDREPQRLKLNLRLAGLYRRLADHEREVEVLTRVVAVAPDDIPAHDRLAELHWQAGRMGQALPHLRRLVEHDPKELKPLRWLAHACEAEADYAGAEAAWLRVLELLPGHLDATERLARARLFKGADGARSPGKAMRLMVLGNCQAYAMGQCLRALAPELEVAAVGWAELTTSEEIDRLASSLGTVDLVLAQTTKDPLLKAFQPDALAEGPTPSAFFPAIHFTGFHPDAVRAAGGGLHSPIGEWHSALALAGYLKSLSPERTAELFNAYVYGVLGYFDEAAKAEKYLTATARRIGWDLSGELTDWRAEGVFVHTPNHPRMSVMMSLARRVCANLGLDIREDAAAPPDPFERYGDWPLYPEIGKRLGLEGALVFAPARRESEALGLEQAIAWYHAVYAKAPAASLRLPRALEVLASLEAEGL